MIKVVKVKLHNPSKHKRAILDKVFLRWTLAMDVTLRWAREHTDAFEDCKDRRGNYQANLIAGVLRRHVLTTIKGLGLHSATEEAVFRELGIALASYFARRKQDPNTGFPTVYRAKPNPARYEAVLDALADFETGSGEDEEGSASATQQPTRRTDGHTLAQLRSELVAAARQLEFRARPIYFCNTDAVPNRRGYSILYDEEKEEYLALVYLLPRSGSSHQRKPLKVHKPLLALNQHQEFLRETGYPSGALLFPLEMGRWQKETFFEPAREHPGIIRTAYLTREKNQQGEVEYYLAIAVDFPEPDPVEAVNLLAVHHTLDGEVFVLITNPEGEVHHYEQVSAPLDLKDVYQRIRVRQRRGKQTSDRVARERTKHHYHNAANRIVALAEEHRARVGVEDLSYVRSKTGYKAVNRRRFVAAIGKLTELLDYKLPFAGLPAPLQVRGVSPRECHRCGPESREKTVRTEGRISCPMCGLEMDVHENNARLVAAQVPEILERIEAARRKRENGAGKGEDGGGKMERGKWMMDYGRGTRENGKGKREKGKKGKSGD